MRDGADGVASSGELITPIHFIDFVRYTEKRLAIFTMNGVLSNVACKRCNYTSP